MSSFWGLCLRSFGVTRHDLGVKHWRTEQCVCRFAYNPIEPNAHTGATRSVHGGATSVHGDATSVHGDATSVHGDGREPSQLTYGPLPCYPNLHVPWAKLPWWTLPWLRSLVNVLVLHVLFQQPGLTEQNASCCINNDIKLTSDAAKLSLNDS